MNTDSRTRISRAFQHLEPDRTPVFEYYLTSGAIWQAAIGRIPVLAEQEWDRAVEKIGWEAAVRQQAADYLDLAAFFGHDMMYIVPNPLPPARAEPRSDTAEKSAESEEPVEKVARRTAQARAAYLGVNEGNLLIYRCLKEEMSRRNVDLPILAPAYAHGVWTDVDLMQTMVLAPETAEEHFAFATQRAMDQIECYLAAGVDMVGIGGDFAGQRPLISPACYRRFILPELRRLSDRIHQAGKYAVNASDGNLWSVLDDFLLNSGVDGYLEIDAHAGMDLARLKSQYGQRITFLGNLDCGNTLSFGSPEKVRQAVRDCLDAGRGSGGHILTASNAIIDSVPLENYMAVVNAYRDYFHLPRLESH